MCMIEYNNLNRNLDLKGVRTVSLLEDTKPKTHMDFGYTMKALRSKKKVVSVLESSMT